MTRVVILVGAVCVVCGCAHVHRVDPISSGLQRDELNRALEARRASLDLRANQRCPFGVTLVGENVRVAADSTFLTVLREPRDITSLLGRPTYAARRDTTLATSAITRASTRSRPRGVLDGIVVGVAAGAAFGALLGQLSSDTWFGPGEYAAGFGTLGAGVGLLIGGVRGSTEIYDFFGE